MGILYNMWSVDTAVRPSDEVDAFERSRFTVVYGVVGNVPSLRIGLVQNTILRTALSRQFIARAATGPFVLLTQCH